MTKYFLKFFILLFVISSTAFTQDEQDVDAIEKARQAKEAAEKAAAEASAATEAAIEAAATKAAKEARTEAKRKKEEEEARKLAEVKAAEEAELDAAASAAAEAAKRKMAEELGLEYDASSDESDDTMADTTSNEAEEFVAKEKLGFNIGVAASYGLLPGETFTDSPTGATIVLTTPLGFKLGPFDYTVSIAGGSYSGQGPLEPIDPVFAGLGGNLTVANLVFAEGHIGMVGEGAGFRGFAGVTLQTFMKNLSLPVNVLIGSELFYSTDMAGVGNPSYWSSLGARLDYGF